MKISKKDALMWFEFFASLPEDEVILPNQTQIILDTFAQIEEAVELKNSFLLNEIKNLKTLEGRTYFVGNENKFPKGCISCLTKDGLTTIRKTNKCNLECKFCYNYGEISSQMPIGEGMWEIGGNKFYEKDIDLLISIQGKPCSVAYVYLEPFMEIEKYYSIIEKFHQYDVHQHIYTNGILANEENLKMLGKCGLNEIRFNLGATDCSDKVIENIQTAKQYIEYVGIETPMTREFFKTFNDKKEKILSTGLDFINCAELHLNENNIYNYYGENMYISRQGYISPVFSRELTLKFMKIADDEKWDLAVHDCSNHTKFARGLNLKKKESGWFGSNDYSCEFENMPVDAFLPILRDENFKFVTEEEMPKGYGIGDIVL